MMGKKSRLLLVSGAGKNRDRLMAWLRQDFEAVSAESVGSESPDFDLAILDGPALDRCGDLLETRKESAAPAFLPVLLLASPRELSLLAHHFPRTVDEVILTPLKKIELLTRVANLLKVRRLSLELHRRRTPRSTLAAPRDLSKRRETLGALAGGIAHEFNNVLGAIKGYIELAMMTLAGGPAAGEVRSKLEAALQAADRALNLVQQLLAFGPSPEEEPQPVEILPIIQGALKLLGASLPGSIEIRPRLEAHCGLVRADPVQLSQLLMNIASKASQAMRDRGGVVEVGLEPVRLKAGLAETDFDMPEGDYVRLTVSDTGHGIVDPFSTSKAGDEGAGLGLSAIFGIVKNLTGAVKVTSKWGLGSTRQIYLPRYRGAPREAPAAGPVPRGTEHILLVDDEPAVVQVSRAYLERLGYRITTRGSSLEAWEEFRRQPESFDLVITDLTMPGMAGVDLAAAMLHLRPELPVILTSGYAGGKIAGQAKAMGLRYCLTKPLELRHLGLVVRRALDKKLRPAPRQPAAQPPGLTSQG
jgi:signal transduction histidine kinase/ActR/RegA family two-component response regulator